LKILGRQSEKFTIETGLKLIILQNQKNIRNLRGKLKWEGDLDQMRTDEWLHLIFCNTLIIFLSFHLGAHPFFLNLIIA